MRGWAWLVRPSINWLLVFIPVSLLAELTHQPLLTFITSALAIVPLAGLIGRATDQLAIRVGPQLGGLLNATFGNLTELIVAVLLIAAGNFEVVKASLIGSIVGNLLLVLGLSLFVGGVRCGEQAFSARAAGVHTGSLVLAVAGLGVPALLVATAPNVSTSDREIVSAGVAATLIALFVAPAMVFISLLLGRPMDFVFTGFEIGAVFIATLIVAVISRDGHSNWLEGVQLIGVYVVIALSAFFL